MENYVPDSSSTGLIEAWIQVLDGQVELLTDDGSIVRILGSNDSAVLPLGAMHSVLTTSDRPACYMYTYFRNQDHSAGLQPPANNSSIPSPTVHWLSPLTKSAALVGQSLLSLVFGVPLVPVSNGNAKN